MDRSDETCRELIYLLWCASGDSCRRLTYSGAWPCSSRARQSTLVRWSCWRGLGDVLYCAGHTAQRRVWRRGTTELVPLQTSAREYGVAGMLWVGYSRFRGPPVPSHDAGARVAFSPGRSVILVARSAGHVGAPSIGPPLTMRFSRGPASVEGYPPA